MAQLEDGAHPSGPAAEHPAAPEAAPRRRGRPRAGEEGEVERRLLVAASRLFLEQGYGRTSLEQVAEAAGRLLPARLAA